MPKPRKILHLDLDAFFCAVEEQLDPGLSGMAVAVGGRPDQRGVVASASYPARAFGVRSAMPMAQALRLCPDLVIVSPHRGAYSQRSRAVMAILRDTAPDVEPLSIDEAFLDVSILPEPIEITAAALQSRIADELGLPASLGGASNKLVAKTANTVGKARQPKDQPPRAITIVPAGEEAAFLAPLPIRRLWGVGPKHAEMLAGLGLTTIGDIAAGSEDALVQRMGKLGADVWRRANGIDHRPVEHRGEAKSISKEVTFAQDIAEAPELKLALRRLADGVGRQARKAGLAGATVKLKLRSSDFSTISRQISLDQPTDSDAIIYESALSLFENAWSVGAPVRLLGVGLGGFRPPRRQMGLWDEGTRRQDQFLDSALDGLRDRFGESTIRRASDLSYRAPNDNKR